MRVAILTIVCAALLAAAAQAADPEPAAALQWEDLPALPDTPGLGGPFAGVHDDVLIVAGGANFPTAPPWAGGEKVWHDDVYVLAKGASHWQTGPHLPRPLAYGASLSTADGVLLIGGCDAERAYADVLQLRWNAGSRQIEIARLPALPEPSAFHAAAQIDSTIYVLAGQRSSDPTDTIGQLWALDLAAAGKDRTWRTLAKPPFAPRIKAVMAAQRARGGTCVYVFSGEIPVRGATEGAVDRTYPADAWRFDPSATDSAMAWKRVADPPEPIAAGCAVEAGASHILAFSGSTGRHIHKPVQERPAFPAHVLAYHTITDTWAQIGRMPTPVVTTALVRWDGRIVITSGEARPGVRTPKVQAARLVERYPGFGAANYGVLGVYLLLLVVIGGYFARRERSTADFFLGGNRIPWWAAGLSIFATMLSAITYLAIPARTFGTDWVYFPLQIGILLIAPAIIFLYLPFFRRLKVTTAYEYLEQRFGLSVRLLGSLSFIVYQLGRMGIVVLLPALALSAVTGLSTYSAVIIMGVLATVYTALGGIEAVIWTDVVQTIVLIGGAVAAVVVIAIDLPGGFGQIVSVAAAQDKFAWVHLGWDWSGDTLPVIALSLIFINLVPYTSDQAVIQRYLTTRDERQAARAIWTNGILAIPASLLFFGVGTALFVYFRTFPMLLAPLEKPDQVFPWFIAQRMPAGLAGLVIAGVFAAAMSSLDSGMHSIATAITTDFVRRFWPRLSERRYLRFARGLTVLLGALGTGTALLLASFDIRFLWDLFLGIVGLLLGTLAGLFSLGILTRRTATPHAWAGALASMAALLYVRFATDLNGLLYAPIGVLTCFSIGAVAGLLWPSRRAAPDRLTRYALGRGGAGDVAGSGAAAATARFGAADAAAGES